MEDKIKQAYQKVKSLYLANGEEYKDCMLPINFLQMMKDKKFIRIKYPNQEILINSEFVVSIVF